MSAIEIIDTKFNKIADGLDGSEGPVFDIHGRFYAVAPMEEAPKVKLVGCCLFPINKTNY